MENNQNVMSQMDEDNDDMDDRLEDMIRDIRESSYKKTHIYDTLCIDIDVSLYKGCINYTRLSVLLKLFNLKAKSGWSDKNFTYLLDLLKQMLPEDNNVSNRCYEAMEILCPMGLEYVKIHACSNDCILYMKEYKKLDQCPEYGESRYKLKNKNGDDNDSVSKKHPLTKVLWYLLIISRLKRFFANANNTRNTRGHVDEIKYDGNILHVSDSL